MYGVEIVAFVTSVGNIKLFGDTDAMSADPTFLSLADTITHDKVDEFLTPKPRSAWRSASPACATKTTAPAAR
ncbi:chorismate synthase, partial [Metarhizium brunneum ARSEF 3297]